MVQLQDNAPKFAAKGARVVAIVTDAPAKNKALATKLGLRFPILSDATVSTTRAYGVEDLGEGIALPASFVIDADGNVVLRYVGDSPRDRPDVADLLTAL